MNDVRKIQEAILSKIKEYNTIFIHNHIRPDPDAVGSQGGLQALIQLNYPNKNVHIVGERLGNLSFLNKVEKREFTKEDYKDSLVIVCDTANLDRIALPENIQYASYVVKIDHHPNHDAYGDLLWVDPDYSSTSEMIHELYKISNDNPIPGLKMDARAARLLYTGIVGDTGRFLFSSVKPSTFIAAADLIQYDFDPQEVFAKLYEKSERLARIEGEILLNFKKTGNGVGYCYITKEMMEQYEVSSNGVSRLVNTLKEVRGHKIWAIFIEEEHKIRVNVRSLKTDIEPVVRKFNGGGHENSAGATVYNWDEAKQLVDALHNSLQN